MSIARGATSSNNDYSGSTFTTLTSGTVALVAGNLNVALYRYLGASVTVASATDIAGNNYTILTDQALGSGEHSGLLYCENVAGHASNVISLSLTGGTARFWSVASVQYSGVATSGSLDQQAFGTSASTTVTSSAFSTTQPNEVLVAGAQVNNAGGTWTAGTGYSSAVQDSQTVIMIEDQIVSTLQSSATASATNSPGGFEMLIAVATFKAAGGGGGGRANRLAFMGVG